MRDRINITTRCSVMMADLYEAEEPEAESNSGCPTERCPEYSHVPQRSVQREFAGKPTNDAKLGESPLPNDMRAGSHVAGKLDCITINSAIMNGVALHSWDSSERPPGRSSGHFSKFRRVRELPGRSAACTFFWPRPSRRAQKQRSRSGMACGVFRSRSNVSQPS